MRKKIFQKCTLLSNVNSIMASSKMTGVASIGDGRVAEAG
jgi:hypothetical protein